MNLQIILNDLNKYKREKSDLLAYYVEMRLNKSFQSYYDELTQSFKYSSRKDGYKVMKKLNKN